MRRRTWLAAAAAPLAALAALAGRPAGATADAAPLVWPALTLIDGSPLAPTAWHDRAAVVVFWATWCAFCKRHNRHIDALHQATRGQPLRVLGIALDSDADLVRRTVAAQGWRFPVALDDGTLRARLTSRRVVPTTCVIDRSGRPRLVIPGEMAEADVMDLARIALRTSA